MKTKSSQLVIRISENQKERLKELAKNDEVSMANYIITKLKLNKKAP